MKLNGFIAGSLLSVAIGCSVSSFNAEASVLVSNWNGSGESGFGDLAMGRNDDGSTTAISFDSFTDLNFDNGLNFFGNTHNEFFINNNGNISFNSSVSSFTPSNFAAATNAMIAPYWADVDTSCLDCGSVYFGSPNADTLVVTWDQVGFFPSNSTLTNTFQLVLIDRADTGAGNFDIEFRYEDINWTTGNASGGSGGLGGNPAQAGFSSGNGQGNGGGGDMEPQAVPQMASFSVENQSVATEPEYFIVPGSNSPEVVNLDTAASNTDTAGIWKFSMRNGQTDGNTADQPHMPIQDPNNPGDYSFEFVAEDNTPVFIDPDVAIGYDYIVNSGSDINSVLLPTGLGDNLFDLWLWDIALNDWYDTGTDITGGVWYNFAQSVDRFRIMGIEVDEMLDPANATAFVTGLMFDTSGVVNMNQTAVTVFVPDATSVPEPSMFILFLTALAGLFVRRTKAQK